MTTFPLDDIVNRAAGMAALFVDKKRIPWDEAEIAVLREWYGRISKAELAKKVEAVRGVKRASTAVYLAATRLGLDPRVTADEICLTLAAEDAGILYFLAHKAARAGHFPTRKVDKFRFIRKDDPAWKRWCDGFLARRQAERAALAAIPESHIGKQEAMKLLNLQCTHITRYLSTGILKAWKIPQGEKCRGYWRISRASVERLLAARREGRLGEILNANPSYRQARGRMNEQIYALRRNRRIGQGDPLTEPKSAYCPGCFTISQVAGHTGLSVQAIYEAIESGKLKAVSVFSGRKRYAIEPEEARRYAKYVRERVEPASYWHKCRRDDIVAAGLLTANDLARRWGVSIQRVTYYCRYGSGGETLPFRMWGRYRVFEPADVEAFEKRVGIQRRNDGTK